MTLEDVREIASQLFVLRNRLSDEQNLISGMIHGACFYTQERRSNCIEEIKFQAFIERLKETAASRYLVNTIEAFIIPTNRLALHINKADLIVSTIIEYRMKKEL